MKKNRRLGILAAALLAAAVMGGCGKQKENVELSMWGAKEDQQLLAEMTEKFKEAYKDEAEFKVTISEENEVTCKETVLVNPSAAADVYVFADDQFDSLRQAGALHEVTEDADVVAEANGGKESAAILSASYDGKLYAYPMTASNGYFLYYNTEYLSGEDVQSFDSMLKAAAAKGKKIAMDFTSGWYLYSFFKGAGLDVEVNEDGTANICNWNATEGAHRGLDVAQALVDISKNKGFLNCGDDGFVAGVKDGSIIAGVNGTWNAQTVKDAYGEHYAAAKLPTYTLAGEQVQMHSFVGYKLVGVNAYSKNANWAMKLAEWITNEENQMKRFEKNGEGPSNVKAAASEKVQSSPAIAAFSDQVKFGHIQRVTDAFWQPVNVFGTTIISGNQDKNKLQKLLDTMVEGITGGKLSA